MIIETRQNRVCLSGAARGNQWPTIKAALRMLLRDYPKGIALDCSAIRSVSEDGMITFQQALREIDAGRARIQIIGLPGEVRARLEADGEGELLARVSAEEERSISRVIYSEEWWRRLWGTTG